MRFARKSAAILATLGLLAGLAPLPAAHAQEAAVTPAPAPSTPLVDTRLLAAGLGAVAGIVLFNLAWGAPMYAFAGEAGAAEAWAAGLGPRAGLGLRGGAAAGSRHFVSPLGGLTGALAGDYAYRRATAPVPDRVAARVTPQ